jgi:hypothetical protein
MAQGCKAALLASESRYVAQSPEQSAAVSLFFGPVPANPGQQFLVVQARTRDSWWRPQLGERRPHAMRVMICRSIGSFF